MFDCVTRVNLNANLLGRVLIVSNLKNREKAMPMHPNNILVMPP